MMRRAALAGLAGLALAAGMAGCGGAGDDRREACESLPMVSFAAEAVDVATGAAVPLTGVRVLNDAGALLARWSASAPDQGGDAGSARLDVRDQRVVFWQATGRFSLELQADGYAPYRRDAIVVAARDPICHYPVTVTFEAPMQALRP